MFICQMSSTYKLILSFTLQQCQISNYKASMVEWWVNELDKI